MSTKIERLDASAERAMGNAKEFGLEKEFFFVGEKTIFLSAVLHRNSSLLNIRFRRCSRSCYYA